MYLNCLLSFASYFIKSLFDLLSPLIRLLKIESQVVLANNWLKRVFKEFMHFFYLKFWSSSNSAI
jgi:hypothetical protein